MAILVAATAPSCTHPHHNQVPDAGRNAADAGTNAPDAGTNAPDAGTNAPDAGSVSGTVRQWPPDRSGYVNPIIAENAHQGTSSWDRMTTRAQHGEIEGYADHVSAHAGDMVQIMVNADSAHLITWQLIRLGWYGGAGGRLITTGGPIAVSPQTPCPIVPQTGLIRCSWSPSFPFEVTSDLVSGLYLFKLTRDDGLSTWVPLVIRDDRPADLLFQSSVLTAQAYNDWHGESLYDNNNGRIVSLGHAVEVSFDRPYVEDTGSGQMLRYEMHLARFLERYGYDVTYTTNLDVVRGGVALVAHCGAFLSVGHDEYWPKAERDALDAARDEGVPLLFFGANAGYWQVRLTDDAGGGAGPRDVIGWKEMWQQDPDPGPELTCSFRNPILNRPENGLIGIMYNSWVDVRAPFTVADESHWLFTGTGLHNGDTIPWLIGYEGDGRFDNGFEPDELQVAAQIPVVSVDGTVETACTTSYRAASGALVFAAGTIEWSYGFETTGVADPRIGRMTANVLREALGLSLPQGLGPASVPAPIISGPFAPDVSTVVSGLAGVISAVARPDGSLVAVDAVHNRILQVSADASRTVSVLAGTGDNGNTGWDSAQPGLQAQFSRPTEALLDPNGNVLVADTGNHCLRMILNDADHTVSTIAGQCGREGWTDGPSASALFFDPTALAMDPVTGALLVADTWNSVIRAVDLATGTTKTVVGIGQGDVDGPAAEAELDFPTALAADPAGNLYIVESGSLRVVRVGTDPDRTVTTLAGGYECGDDGPGTTACLGTQLGLVWSNGALYLPDGANGRIRRLVPGVGASDTQVTTLAGCGSGELDGTGAAARFLMPAGLAVAADGSLLVTDYGAGSIRTVGFP
jgi:DNA-binding beta-propeller fold protein YncE